MRENVLLKPLWQTGLWQTLKKKKREGDTTMILKSPSREKWWRRPYTHRNKNHLQDNMCRIRWYSWDRGLSGPSHE